MDNKREIKRTVDVLAVLDLLDEFRRKHQNDKQHPADWCMRCMEAIVAKEAGYTGRNEWTDELLADPETAYHKEFGRK